MLYTLVGMTGGIFQFGSGSVFEIDMVDAKLEYSL